MPYTPIDADPGVPAGSVLLAEVVISHYFDAEGKLRRRTSYEGDVPISTVLGLIELAKVDIIARYAQP